MALNPEYISPLIIALIALLCSAFFSGMEIAFVSSNKVRAEIEMSRGGIINGLLNIFYGNREMFISTLLIGNNIANIVYSMAMARLLTIPLQQWITNEALLLLVQTIIATLIILLFGEFIPKSVFRINPNASLRTASIPLFMIYCLLYPISLFTEWISASLMKLFGIKMSSTRVRLITVDELDARGNHIASPRDIERESLVALVVIMPLVGQHRVVEFTGSRRSGRGFRGRFRGRIDLTVRGFGGKDIVLDNGHLCQFCRLENRPIQLSILFQVHHEPAVQAKLPLQIFLSGKRLEQRFHRQDALELQFFQFRIGRPGCKFDQERGHVPLVAQVHHFRPGGTGDVHHGRQRFLPAGNQDGKQRDGHKDNSAISHHNSFIDKRPGDNAPGLICRNTNRLNVTWSSGRFL